MHLLFESHLVLPYSGVKWNELHRYTSLEEKCCDPSSTVLSFVYILPTLRNPKSFW